MVADSKQERFRFGAFEVNLKTGEACKHGVRIKLQGQPYEILHLLLERPGDVVTREEMRRRLWPADTFVQFEHSMNSAVKKLRRALGDSAAAPRYIETLPRVGYRFIAPVEKQAAADSALESAAAGAPVARPHPGTSPTAERWLHRGWPVLLALVTLLSAVLGGYWHWSRSLARQRASSTRMMLAVLPFENLTGDAAQDYFSDGLTEEMIAQLGRLEPQRLGVIARTSVMHYKHTQQSLRQIGGELGVQYVLEGSVRRDSENVRISAQLIQVKDQTHAWSRQYNRKVGGLLALQGEIAREIADEIELILGEDGKRFAANRKPATPSSDEAYDLYLKGLYFWNQRTPRGFHQAAEYFQQAIVKDPNFARAYAGLADTFGLMSTWGQVPQNQFMPKAHSAALRALEIDESLAEAHTSLALIAENYEYDWQTAEKEFKRAIQLDPSYATAHHWYAEYLSWQGRFDDALAESGRARQLDPLSVIIATDRGAILYFSRQYQRAIEQLRTVLEMDPNFTRAYGLLISAHVQQGRFEDAVADIENLRRHVQYESHVSSAEAYVWGRWGRQAEARHALARLKQQVYRQPEFDPTPLLLLAYVGLNRRDEAIALLQKACSERSNAVTGLKVDPSYDQLRGDPRFQDLLRCVHLAQ